MAERGKTVAVTPDGQLGRSIVFHYPYSSQAISLCILKTEPNNVWGVGICVTRFSVSLPSPICECQSGGCCKQSLIERMAVGMEEGRGTSVE